MKITSIVFTKDRPLQLEAYLESLFRYFPQNKIDTYVLYKAGEFDREYNQVWTKFDNCTVVRENNFYKDLTNLVDAASGDFILFGVDDVVFFDSVDLNVVGRTFDSDREGVLGFSLRLDYEMVVAGGDSLRPACVAGQTVFGLDWTQGKSPPARYPFELCATIYPATIVKRILHGATRPARAIGAVCPPLAGWIGTAGRALRRKAWLRKLGLFYDPNTFESWLCRWCQKHSGELPSSLYFQKQCAAAVQVNMVNVSTDNVFDGTKEYCAETLAEKYRSGLRLDIDFVRQTRPKGTHCGRSHFKLVKKT